jgi:hypothetical protein
LRLSTELHEDVIYAEHHKAGASGYRARLTPGQQQNFDLFFDKYVHDSIAGFKQQLSDSHISIIDSSRYTYTRCMFVGKKSDSYYLWRYKGFLPETAVPEKQAMYTPEQRDEAVA